MPWICSACSNENPDKWDICSLCQAPQHPPTAPAAPPADQAVPSEPPATQQAGGFPLPPMDQAPTGEAPPTGDGFAPPAAGGDGPDNPYAAPESSFGAAPGGKVFPWENRSQLGIPQAIWQTTKGLFGSPKDTWGLLSNDGDWASPLIFGVIITYLSGFFNAIWNSFILGFTGGPQPLPPGLPPEMNRVLEVINSMNTFSGIWLGWIFSGLIFLVIVFIMSGLMHGFLRLTGGGKLGFLLTVKIYCYAQIGVVLAVIPMCGAFAGFIASIVFLVMGILWAHKGSGLQAALGGLGPYLFMCCCIVGVSMGIGAMAASMVP